SLPWFDIDTEEVKYATIDDSAIRVGPVRSSAQDEPMQLTTDASGNVIEDGEDNGMTLSQNGALDSLVTEQETPMWILVLAAALTALLGVITYFTAQRRSEVREAKKKEPQVSAPMYRQSIAPESEAVAFKEFLKACEN